MGYEPVKCSILAESPHVKLVEDEGVETVAFPVRKRWGE
jgi:hypothetical protein